MEPEDDEAAHTERDFENEEDDDDEELEQLRKRINEKHESPEDKSDTSADGREAQDAEGEAVGSASDLQSTDAGEDGGEDTAKEEQVSHVDTHQGSTEGYADTEQEPNGEGSDPPPEGEDKEDQEDEKLERPIERMDEKQESSEEVGDLLGDKTESTEPGGDSSTPQNSEPRPESESEDEVDPSEKAERVGTPDAPDEREQTSSQTETPAEEPTERNQIAHESITTEPEEDHASNEGEHHEVDPKQDGTSEADAIGLQEGQAHQLDAGNHAEVDVTQADGKPDAEEHDEAESSLEAASGQNSSTEQHEDIPAPLDDNFEHNDSMDMEAAMSPETATVKEEESAASSDLEELRHGLESVQQTDSGPGDISESREDSSFSSEAIQANGEIEVEALHEGPRANLEGRGDLTTDNSSHSEDLVDEQKSMAPEPQDGSAHGADAGDGQPEHAQQNEQYPERQADSARQEKQPQEELRETIGSDSRAESERLVHLEPVETYERQNEGSTVADGSPADGARAGISEIRAGAATARQSSEELDNGLPIPVGSATETNFENGDSPTINQYKIDASHNLPSIRSHDGQSLQPTPVFDGNDLERDRPILHTERTDDANEVQLSTVHEFAKATRKFDVEPLGNPRVDESTSSLGPWQAVGQPDSTVNNSVEQRPPTKARLNNENGALESRRMMDHEGGISIPRTTLEAQPTMLSTIGEEFRTQTDAPGHSKAGFDKLDPIPNNNKSKTDAKTNSLDARDVGVPLGATSYREKPENQEGATALGNLQGKLVESKSPLFVAYETKGGPSNYLRFPRELLAKYGKEDILEARVARASAPEKQLRFYTNAGYADPHLNISHLKPTHREPFNFLSLEKYEVSDFVRDFNKKSPKDFRNVTLSDSDGIVTMKVDNNVVEVKHPKLIADGGRAILEGSLIENRKRGILRIAKSSETFDLHFADHPRVVYMKANGSNIEAGYIQTSSEPDHRTRQIPAISVEPLKGQGQSNLAKHELLELDRSNLSRKEIRAWIDTEGSIYSRRRRGGRGVELAVTQKHREPLDAYSNSLAEMGVRCKIYQDKRGLYVAKILDTEGIAKVISEVGPFRTPQRTEQVRLFMEKLKAPRKERRRVIERSKKLLGL